jgi:hypothetical protein
MSLEGDSNREIGLKLGLPRQNVDYWMRKQRRIWAKAAARKTEELVLARLEAVYGAAMRGCRSAADQPVAETAGGEGEANGKSPPRKESQAGQAALLGKAMQAVLEISKFQAKHLEALREDKAKEGRAAVDKLAAELSLLSKEDFQLLKFHVPECCDSLPGRTLDDLMCDLLDLSESEFRALRQRLDDDYNRQLPLRRREASLEEVQEMAAKQDADGESGRSGDGGQSEPEVGQSEPEAGQK